MAQDSPDTSGLVRLLEERPRVFWGKVIETLIKQGWNPPDADRRVLENILDAIRDIEKFGYVSRAGQHIRELTPMEGRVAVYLCDGYSNEDIAHKLGIAPQTVKFHMTHIMEKLEAKNRAHAVAILLREGMVH